MISSKIFVSALFQAGFFFISHLFRHHMYNAMRSHHRLLRYTLSSHSLARYRLPDRSSRKDYHNPTHIIDEYHEHNMSYMQVCNLHPYGSFCFCTHAIRYHIPYHFFSILQLYSLRSNHRLVQSSLLNFSDSTCLQRLSYSQWKSCRYPAVALLSV